MIEKVAAFNTPKSRISFYFSLIGLFYLLVFLLQARNLTFYWDDYFVLYSIFEFDFFKLLLSGVNGNWWPLSSVLVWIEVRLFGSWYLGYLLFNLALTLFNTVLIWLIARQLFPKAPQVLVASIVIIYPFTLQVIVNATVVTPSWPLSITFTLFASLFVLRNRSLLLPTLFLIFSWLSMSGMIFVNCLIFSSFLFIRNRNRGMKTIPKIGQPALFIIAGAIGSLIGSEIMKAAPSNKLTQTSNVLDQLFIVNIFEPTFALSTSWIISPLIPLSYVDQDVLTWLTLLFAKYLWLIIPLMVSSFGFLLWRQSKTRGTPSANLMVQTLVFLLPIFGLALVLGVTRSGNPFAPRYGVMWLIPVLIIWIGLLVSSIKLSRGVRLLVLALPILTLTSTILLFPFTLRSAIDADRERSRDSERQSELISLCLQNDFVRPLNSMAPGLDAEDFCPMMRNLNSVWLFSPHSDFKLSEESMRMWRS